MVQSPAVFVSSTVVNCTAPPHAAGVVAVEVTTNGVDFSTANVSYVFVPLLRILAVVPKSGPTAGNTNVSIVGTGMLPGSSCQFGDLPALSSSWLSENELVCVSPAQSGSPAVEVTSNDRDWSSDGLRFNYRSAVSVASLAPLVGPMQGGTVLTVSGTGMVRSDLLSCRFGGSVVMRATWVDVSSVACVTPPRTGALPQVVVEVSSNNQQFSADGTLFEYEQEAVSYTHLTLPTILLV